MQNLFTELKSELGNDPVINSYLDELFEILTWNQLSIHDKPVYILNSGGFYDALLQHMQLMMQENFLYNPLNEVVTVLSSPEELFSTS